jgi:hypothetical protein
MQVVKVFSRSSEYPRSIIKIAVQNVLWTFPFTLLPLSTQLPGYREGERCYRISIDIVMYERGVLIAWSFRIFPIQ